MFAIDARAHFDLVDGELQPLTSDPCVVTIGTFDGFHQGHRAVVSATCKIANDRRLRAIAVTFDPRPEIVVRSGQALPDLVSLDERVASLLAAGVDSVVVLRFSLELARLPANEFFARLGKVLPVDCLCVGEDFALGRGKSVGAAAIAAMGIKVHTVPLVAGNTFGVKASSTNVRRAIARGISQQQAFVFA